MRQLAPKLDLLDLLTCAAKLEDKGAVGTSFLARVCELLGLMAEMPDDGPPAAVVNHQIRELTINLRIFYVLFFVSCSGMRKHSDTKLPASHIQRWTIRRKATLLGAIRSGVLTLEQARRRYDLSVEELRAWELVRPMQKTDVFGISPASARRLIVSRIRPTPLGRLGPIRWGYARNRGFLARGWLYGLRDRAPVLADCRPDGRKKICLVRGTKRLQSVVLISVIQTRFTFQNSGPVNSNFPARLLR